MGGSSSKKKREIIEIIGKYIERTEGLLTEKEFAGELFRELDNNPQHSEAGEIMVRDTHVLTAFYAYIHNKVILSVLSTVWSQRKT